MSDGWEGGRVGGGRWGLNDQQTRTKVRRRRLQTRCVVALIRTVADGGLGRDVGVGMGDWNSR